MVNRTFNIFNAYLKSMRPYTFFVTGTAGILGFLLVENQGGILRSLIILILLFTSYGINQVINDLLGSKEDKYNAPLRPLVSGEISRKDTILITAFLFTAGAIGTYFINPYALTIYFLAYLMNIIYEQFKGIPVLGNVWFGFLIALAPLYGALAAGNLSLQGVFANYNLIYFAILVAASSSTLCYYTYFKDYEGDKKALKKTIIVALGPQRARYLNFPMSFLPFLLLWIFIRSNLLTIEINHTFSALITITFVFCNYAAFFSFKNLNQEKKSLELHFECTPLFLSSLIALLEPALGLSLFIFSFAFIKIFYWLMYKKNFY